MVSLSIAAPVTGHPGQATATYGVRPASGGAIYRPVSYSSAQIRQHLVDARTLTEVYQAHDASAIALREAACLQVMLPQLFQPMLEGDLLAGRIVYPVVGVSPEPGGLGYYCHFDVLSQWRERSDLTDSDRAEIDWLIGYWDGRTTRQRVRAAFDEALAAVMPGDYFQTQRGIGFALYRIAGCQIDYHQLLAKGLGGLIEHVRSDWGGSVEDPAVEAMVVALESVGGIARAYAEQAVAMGLLELSEGLRHIATAPPRTLVEAMQLAWLYSLSCGAQNYGRMDDYLGSFLTADLQAGRLDEQSAQLLVDGLWQLISDRNTVFNGRVILGGRGRRDPEAADRFAVLAVEATRRLGGSEPQLSLRYDPAEPSRLLDRALACIGAGTGLPMLYNDAVNVPAVAKALGVSASDAVDYLPYGCGEFMLNHASVSTPNGIINLMAVLEDLLIPSDPPIAGSYEGARDFADFADLYNAFDSQLRRWSRYLAQAQQVGYQVTAGDCSLLLLSAVYDDCVARGRMLLAGGVRHLGGTMESYGNTNAADALHAIDQAVYRRQWLSLDRLTQALRDDFQSDPALQRRLQRIAKYGNDDPQADAMAQRVHQSICHAIADQAVAFGMDSYRVVVINNQANTELGRLTGAGADGRPAGAPMANANNPHPGADRNGVTAMLQSLSKLDNTIHAGMTQNLKLSRRWFEDDRRSVAALVDSWFALGGSQLMISVVDAGDLEAAIDQPERYGHLVVRVGGFTARFIDLSPPVQQEVLSRTLY